MHTPHPDSHTHGLADDCPECQGRAENPNGLDDANLRRLWHGDFHTETDARAYSELYRRAVTTQRLEQALGIPRGVHGFADSVFDHGGKR